MDDGHIDHDHDETFREHSHLSTALQKYHNLAKNIEKNQTHHLFYQVVLWECLKIISINIRFHLGNVEGLRLKMCHLNWPDLDQFQSDRQSDPDSLNQTGTVYVGKARAARLPLVRVPYRKRDF